jgi:hypothetical protein
MQLKPLQTETDRAEYGFRFKLKEMERTSLATDNPKTYLSVQSEDAPAAPEKTATRRIKTMTTKVRISMFL